MKYIIILIIFLFILFIVKLKEKYNNPYKLYLIFGNKGSGKSTLLTKLSIKYNLMGWKVYSNTEIFNTYKLDISDIGIKDFTENSVLLIDEVGTIWDNRNFKNFTNEVRDFYKYQRHNKLIVYLSSQTFDIDKKIRDMCDGMYMCQCYFNFLSVAKRIVKRPSIKNSSGSNGTNNESTITYDLEILPFFYSIYTFIPRYVEFYNSFVTERKPLYETEKYTFTNNNELIRLQLNWYWLSKTIKTSVYQKWKQYKDYKEGININDFLYNHISERYSNL